MDPFSLALLLGGGSWLGSKLFGMGGKEPTRPEAPKMGPFQPYKIPIQPQLGLISEGLERQGQKATRGMYQQAAKTGTFYGGQPGAVEIAAAKTEALGAAELGLMQQQNLATMKQYTDWIAQQYGYESMEYQTAMTEYLQRLQGQQEAQSSLWGGLLSAGGTALGGYFGGLG